MADLEADLGLGGHVCEVIPKRHKQKSGGSETEKGEKPETGQLGPSPAGIL